MSPTEKSDIPNRHLSAGEISCGISRVLEAMGYSALSEFELGNQRRIDVAAINRRGLIAFVEIKSSVSDFRSDAKWPLYLDYCDLFFFGVAPDFPLSILEEKPSLPERTGIMIADHFGGEIIRNAMEVPVNAARRKSETLRFARRAADRLQRHVRG